ncbi:hypothetical protein EXU11_10700 [Klebsiella quasipneumoniae subsp. quasipneumoniae]|nr:hypothetical protein EXU05_10260 [Klebsiella quasipneumoniae subsp. quasipneumoniae]TBP73558.1 hypothetical protein EXT99_08065 [Klebsiella quasipneumoniae subsp. quasipneumoniae]TBQ68592.1 hypothetical protein EXU11_10700 [Klebsiella quasipneumoniae subsp. quasipneumoniae]
MPFVTPGSAPEKRHPRQETWRRPAQAQRRRARTAGAEPRLCRVAANALPDLRLRTICHPGQRSGKTPPATGNLA